MPMNNVLIIFYNMFIGNGYNVMSEGNKSPPTKRQFRSFDLNCTPEMTADINGNLYFNYKIRFT